MTFKKILTYYLPVKLLANLGSFVTLFAHEIDKITLLLVMTTLSWDFIKNYLGYSRSVSVKTLLSRVKCSVLHMYQTVAKTRGQLCKVNLWKMSRIFSSATFHSFRNCLGLRMQVSKYLHRSADMIFPFHLNLDNYYVAIVPFQPSADNSHWDIVERHVQCAQCPMHLAESAAPSGSSRLHFSMNFGSRN